MTPYEIQKKRKPLKQIKMFVLKHKTANFPVRGGIYEDKTQAITTYNSIPSYAKHEYEIVVRYLKKR